MKQFLLPSLLLSAALGMTAATPAADLQVKSGNDAVKVKNVTNSGTPTKTKRLAPGVTMTTGHGLKHLNMAPERMATNKVAPRKTRKTAPFKAEDSGQALFESFEGWDGETEDWLPEGWTVDRRGGVSLEDSWMPSYTAYEYNVAAPDGNYAYAIYYSGHSPKAENGPCSTTMWTTTRTPMHTTSTTHAATNSSATPTASPTSQAKKSSSPSVL